MTDMIKELEAQKKAIEAQIEKELGKAQAREEIVDIAKARGYTIEELFGDVASTSNKTNKTNRRTRKPDMYQNPENKMQRWSGVTAKPQWVLDWEAAGKDIEEARIPGT